MIHFSYLATLAVFAASICRAGNFPEDSWGPGYLENIPHAIRYVETHAPFLTLDPPPDDDSEETLSEIAYLRRIAKSRSSRDVVLVTKENLDPQKHFFEVLEIERDDYPELDKLLIQIASESYLPVLYFKHKFSRTRPYQIDNELTTVIDGPPHASYPSGHATQGYLIALILSEIVTKDDARATRLMELGKGMGARREIAGVHYPSDTKAGIDLAIQLKAWLMGKPDFQQYFQAAKSEALSPQQEL